MDALKFNHRCVAFQYQFWSYPSEVGMTVQMMVPPHKFSDFAELQETHGFETDLLIANLQE